VAGEEQGDQAGESVDADLAEGGGADAAALMLRVMACW